jgi:hypothetical protein
MRPVPQRATRNVSRDRTFVLPSGAEGSVLGGTPVLTMTWILATRSLGGDTHTRRDWLYACPKAAPTKLIGTHHWPSPISTP